MGKTHAELRLELIEIAKKSLIILESQPTIVLKSKEGQIEINDCYDIAQDFYKKAIAYYKKVIKTCEKNIINDKK